jgi:hypothetical protein
MKDPQKEIQRLRQQMSARSTSNGKEGKKDHTTSSPLIAPHLLRLARTRTYFTFE